MRWVMLLFLGLAACGSSDNGVCKLCSTDPECGAGLSCDGPSLWCTKSCSNDSDCKGDHCMLINAGGAFCFPACDHDASRCSMYAVGVSCQSLHDAHGVLVKVCSE